MVPPCSDRMSRVPPYSRATPKTSPTGLSPITPGFPTCSAVFRCGHWPGPRSLATTDGVSLMSFPRGTEMFQFPRFAFETLCVQVPNTSLDPPMRRTRDRDPECRTLTDRRWVSPFGDPWIKARSRLPKAYRSVPRPSSPLSAKASTGCSSDT